MTSWDFGLGSRLKADQREGYLPVDGAPEQMGITELRVHQVLWGRVCGRPVTARGRRSNRLSPTATETRGC
ncbi:hypothetical protein MINTMi198_40800 [Mycobacterium intracellulare M.i.198]|nr:hypothetical protein MINTMi198_40800 [Mycobacterium intracellulare M.i.198]